MYGHWLVQNDPLTPHFVIRRSAIDLDVIPRAILPKVQTGRGVLVNPGIQGQRQVDRKVNRKDRPVLKPILGQVPSVRRPLGQEPPHRRPLRRILVKVSVVVDGRPRRGFVLADEDVHGAVLQAGDAARLREDVDARHRAPGRLEPVARPMFDDAGVGPVLEVAKNLGVVLGHVDRLVLGFSETPTERRAKEFRGIAEELLVHVEDLSVGPDSDLDDRIERVPVRRLMRARPFLTVSQALTYRLGLYVASRSDSMLVVI